MRGALLFIWAALAATMVVAGLLLVATGKTYMFSFGAGHPNSVTRAAGYAFVAFWVAVAAGAVLHLCAHTFPRRYFQVMWWRDFAFIAAGGSLLFVMGVQIWRQVSYGVV